MVTQHESENIPNWWADIGGGFAIGISIFALTFLILYPFYKIAPLTYPILFFCLGGISFLFAVKILDPQDTKFQFHICSFLPFFYFFQMALNYFDYFNPLLLGILLGIAWFGFLIFQERLSYRINSLLMSFIFFSVIILIFMVASPEDLVFKPEYSF